MAWYKKCASACDSMLKEEAILIKERLTKDDLTTFPNKKTWFESFKQTY